MSRPSSVSPRPPAPSGGGPGGGGGGPASCGPGGGGRAKGLKDIRIDEEVKIAVNIALERFRYGDQRGKASDGGTLRVVTRPPPGSPLMGRGTQGQGRAAEVKPLLYSDCWSWSGMSCGSAGLGSSRGHQKVERLGYSPMGKCSSSRYSSAT